MTATERRIEEVVAKYTPSIAAQLRDARQRLRAHVPRGVAEFEKQRPRRPAAAKA